MTVTVSFVTTESRNHTDTAGVAGCRVAEDLALNGTTTATALFSEVIIVANGETSMIRVAVGTTPNAAASSSTAATSAGVPIPAGLYQIFVPKPGDKINVKALA